MQRTTYTHKLTGETLTAISTGSINCPITGDKHSTVNFRNEKGEERAMTNRQIERLLK